MFMTHLYVRSKVHSLGADCIEKPLEDKHKLELRRLLDAAGINAAVGCQ
jgi:methylamine---glutamate N-methyltransferase subunit B